MAKLDEVYKVGDTLEVTISSPKIGKFPIGKTEKGLICLFERTKQFFELGSIWEVEVTKVQGKNLVVKHIKQTKSVKEIDNEYQEKLNEFRLKGNKSGNIKFM